MNILFDGLSQEKNDTALQVYSSNNFKIIAYMKVILLIVQCIKTAKCYQTI